MDDARPADFGPLGVLALQGSFPLHVRALERCGAETRDVRKPADLEGISGLVIPGGESTTFSVLAGEYGLFEPLVELGRSGLPMFGTCAGAILLGRGDARPKRLNLVDVEVDRNAYGRQVDSFSAEVDIERFETPFPAIFIRAPKFRILKTGREVEVLGRCEGEPVLLRSGPFLLASFHPELTDDLRIHRLFLDEVVDEKGR